MNLRQVPIPASKYIVFQNSIGSLVQAIASKKSSYNNPGLNMISYAGSTIQFLSRLIDCMSCGDYVYPQTSWQLFLRQRTNKYHRKANLDIFDFELSEEDMKAIAAV